MIALSFLLARKVKEERERMEQEEREEEPQEALRELFESLNIEVPPTKMPQDLIEEKKAPPPPPAKPIRSIKKPVIPHHAKVHPLKKTPWRQGIVLREILGPPKGL